MYCSIPESSQLGSAVIQINALDSDSEFGSNLTYSMLTNKYFAIDRNTGTKVFFWFGLCETFLHDYIAEFYLQFNALAQAYVKV